MLRNDSVTKYYKAILFDDLLTTSFLNDVGFSSNDLTNMVKSGSLIRVARGLYSYNDANDLLAHASVLKTIGFDMAVIYRKCFEINKDYQTGFKAFTGYLFNGNFEQAFKLIPSLFEVANIEEGKDLKYFLYLCSLGGILPKEEIDIIKDLTIQDILLNENNDGIYQNIEKANMVRTAAFNLGAISSYYRRKTNAIANKSPQEYLEYYLLTLGCKKANEYLNTIIGLIENQNIDNLIAYLDEIKASRKFFSNDTILYALAKKYAEISYTGIVPAVKKHHEHIDDDIMTLINDNDFIMVQKSSEHYCKSRNLNVNRSATYLMAKALNSLVDKLRNNNRKVDIETIKALLIDGNIFESTKIISKYLSLINKTNYERLIITLLKIDFLQGDFSFADALSELSLLKENYVFDCNKYLNIFLSKIAKKELKDAREYLYILEKYGNNIDINSLRTLLNNANSSREENSSLPQLDEKYQELIQKRSLVMLDDIDEKDVKVYLEEINKLSKVKPLVVPWNGKNKIILRYYRPEINDNINSLVSAGGESYRTGNWEKCIDKYKPVLSHFYNVNAYVYNRVGISYLRLGNKEEAFMYLLAATYISQNFEKGYTDYTELLHELEKEIDFDSKRGLRIFMNPSNYFEVPKAKELIDYIDISGLDVYTVCKQFNVNEIDMLKIQIIYARKFYTAGMFGGDKFVSFVERYIEKHSIDSSNINELLELAKQCKEECQKKEPKALVGTSITLKPCQS